MGEEGVLVCIMDADTAYDWTAHGQLVRTWRAVRARAVGWFVDR